MYIMASEKLENLETMDIDVLKKRCGDMYFKLTPGERAIKYDMLVIASDPDSLMNFFSPPAEFFPVNLAYNLKYHVKTFEDLWARGRWSDNQFSPYADLVRFRVFEDTPVNERKCYATIYKVLMTPV